MPSEFRKSVKSVDVDEKSKPKYEATREGRVSYQPSLTETKVPDAYEDLRSELVKFGLSTRDVEAVTEYMKNFSPDDLSMLNQAVKDVGMPLNRRRIFFISYSRRRGIPIPPELCDELGITPYDTSPSYGYSSWKRPRYEGETSISDLIALFVSQQQANQQALLEWMKRQDEWMRALLLNRSTNDDSSHNTALENRIQLLEEKLAEKDKLLQEERQKRLEDKIAQLEQKIGELEKKPMNVELKKLDILDGFRKDVTRLGEYLVKGSMEPVTPPKRKEDKSLSELSVEELESLGIPYEIEGGGE
jgi:site-specific DNA-cytosine methylase